LYPIGDLYYSRLTRDEYNDHMSEPLPRSFPDVVKPHGWDFARDSAGDQAKYAQQLIIKEGPVEDLTNATDTLSALDDEVENWLNS